MNKKKYTSHIHKNNSPKQVSIKPQRDGQNTVRVKTAFIITFLEVHKFKGTRK